MKTILLLLTLTLFSCNLIDRDCDRGLNFDEEAFTANYNLWRDSHIENYTFTQEVFSTSFGPMPKVQVKVENGSFNSYEVKTETNLDERDLIYYITIDELFFKVSQVVEECYESLKSSQDPMIKADINVVYDQTYGYPTLINCTGYYKEGWVGGLCLTIEISDFRYD